MDDRWTSPDGGPSPSESGRETDAEPAADERKGPYTIPKAAPGSQPAEGRLFDSSGLPNPGGPAAGDVADPDAETGAAGGGRPEHAGGAPEPGGAEDSPAPGTAPVAPDTAEGGSGTAGPAPYTPSAGGGAPDSPDRSFTTSGSGDSDDTAAFGTASGTDTPGQDSPGARFAGADFSGSDFGSSAYSSSGADGGSEGGFPTDSPGGSPPASAWSGSTSGSDPYSSSSASAFSEDRADGADSTADRPWEQSAPEGFGSGTDYASSSFAGPASDPATGGSGAFADSPVPPSFAGGGSAAPLSGENDSFRGADSAGYGTAGTSGSTGYGSSAAGSGYGDDSAAAGASGADSPGWDAPGDRYGTYGAAAQGYGSDGQAADPYGSNSASGGNASLYGAAGGAGAAGAAAYGAADGSAPYGTPSHGSPSHGSAYGTGAAGSYGSPDFGGTSGEAPGSRPWDSSQQPPAGSGSSGADAPYGASPTAGGAAGSDSTSVFPAAGPGPDSPGRGGADSGGGPGGSAEAPYDPYGPYGPYGGRPAASGPQRSFGAAASGPQASAAAGGYGPGGPYGDAGSGGPHPPSDPYAEDYGDEAPRKKSRKGLFIGIGAVALVLVLAGGVTGWYLFGRGPGPDETAATFAAAWNEQDAEAMAAAASGNPADVLDPIVDNLGVEATAIEVGEVTEGEDQTASAPFTATLSLKNAGDWTYENTMDLVREDGEWKVDFSPATVHPELSEGSTLVRGNVWGDRGRILASDGSPIDTQDTSESVQMLAGSVGTAAEEDLERLGPAYAAGDPAGASGLQATYEERLAGKASISIRVAEEGSEEDVAADTEAPALETLEGEPGRDVTTTIDPALQGAASSAVSGASKPTALVAIRPSSGEIVASANNTPGFNRAFEGQYAPGSAFKIVTYEALLENGLTTDATMDCPKEAMGFTNAGDAKYGKQTVTEAFATSCNTALVQDVVNRLDGSTMTAAAEMFGMNQELQVGVPAHEPSFPTPDSTGMLAAQSIGQGQILTTPLHMATVPAAVADGSWRAPTLVSDPEPKDLPEPTAVPHAEALRPMMRAVVTDGTAEDSGFKGEVFGKTGSAEFGTAENEDDELDTHAWMVGYKGDIAFAVVVEGGGGGGSVAGPIGAKFANGL